MIRNGVERNRGFVLIVALGVLGVLGLLAATFATLSKVERSVSASYVDKVRAKLLAQSGIERAIAAIRGRAMSQAWDDPRNDWYYRELLNEASGTLTYPGGLFAGYIPVRKYGMPARSLETALDDGIVNLKPGGISFPDSTSPAISGKFPGTYQPDGDIYGLKVIDCASQIYVNDAQKNIVFILNNLGKIVKTVDGAAFPGGFLLGDQMKLKAAARGKPFNNKAEVRDEVFINNSFFADKVLAGKYYDAVKDYISCHEWVDGETCRFDKTWNTSSSHYHGGIYSSTWASGGPASGSDPVAAADPGTGSVPASVAGKTAYEAPMAPEFATSPMFTVRAEIPGTYVSMPATSFFAAPAPSKVKDIKKGGGFDQEMTGSLALTSNGKFAASTYYFMEPRAPINVNTATREVLVATMWGLAAQFWDYDTVSEGSSKKEYTGGLVMRTVTITQPDAEAIADFIISGRFTFGKPTAGGWSYNDWMHFEEDVIDYIPGIDRFKKALIKANANPNSNIKKLNPDLILVASNPAIDPSNYVRLDKSDISQPTTEWTFASNGFYEIESIGRVYDKSKIMAEEKIETVVKVYDMIRFTTQDQLEDDRTWLPEDSKEGDLMAAGYPPVVSMPEYAYNNPKVNPAIHYKSQAGDVLWCADYEGYLILNGPVMINAGIAPGPAATDTCTTNPDAADKLVQGSVGGYGWSTGGYSPGATYGPLPSGSINRTCRVSFIAGYNNGSVDPNQSHHIAAHIAAGSGHPEYAYSMPDCWGTSGNQHYPVNSTMQDVDYKSGGSYNPMKPYQIEPAAAGMGWAPTADGCNFWDNGCDVQNFGVYYNRMRRLRFNTYWADELPNPDCTIEMMVKPEIDNWNWAPKSTMKAGSSGWGPAYHYGPCSRMNLFEVGPPQGSEKSNYNIRLFVQLSRVYLEFLHMPATAAPLSEPNPAPGVGGGPAFPLDPAPPNGTFYTMYCDHQWKPHTWHHVEASWVRKQTITLSDGSKKDIPANAMLFVDGKPATSIIASPFPSGTSDVNGYSGIIVYPGVKAMVLPTNVIPFPYNNDIGTGPRLEIGSRLQDDGSFVMSQADFIGTIDNVVFHHWRSHSDLFTPRNRYHSATYYDGSTYKVATGYAGETAGVYKKRLTALESVAMTKDVTIGTLSCTHYHPYHVHLYGHDGGAPTTSFGHITPSLRAKSGGTYIDYYYYDGCAGLPIKTKITPGQQLFYMGWFEVASLVPVTMSPMLGDIGVTYFTDPVSFYRLSSTEAKK